ncbi:MAG: hypothetical protein VYA94_03955 [Candidatus Thermoplasmatota archaeon]|nr:hypothetical protein [Candidatus Thermoplasmatota archaeon]
MRSGLFAISVILGIVTTLAFHTISINYPSPFFENGKDVLTVSKSDSEINGLEFGASSGSIFNIEPDSSIGININFSSQMENDKQVLLIIDWPDRWNVSWNYESSPDIGKEYIISPGQLIWTEFTISSPSVVGGFPLSQSLHDFSMSLVGLDGQIIDWYNFSLRYGNYDAIEILQGGGSSSISPGGTVTLETIVRNIGNSIRTMQIEIVAIGEEGGEISEPGSFFSSGNWSASVIERWRVEDLAPNATGSVLVQVFSPSEIGDALNFEIRVWSTGNSLDYLSVNHEVSVVPRDGGEISILEDGCSTSNIIPGDACEVRVVLVNTGDSPTSFRISLSGIPEWINLHPEMDFVELQTGESSDPISIVCQVKEDTLHNLTSRITITLSIGDWSPGEVSFGVKSGALFSWSLGGFEEDIDSGNLTGSWTVTNTGNSIDGLIASIDSSVVTGFGIDVVVPNSEIIVFKSDRALEVYPVNPGQSIEILGWMEVPKTAPTDTIVNLSVEMRSAMDPGILIIEAVSINISGEAPSVNSPEKGSFREPIIRFLNLWLEPTMIVSVILIGLYGTSLALKKTSTKSVTTNKSEEEGDWMSKFSRSKTSEISLERSVQIEVSEFEKSFFGHEGRPDVKSQSEISLEAIDDASRLLDDSKEKSDIEEVLRIAEELESQDLLHPDNVILDIQEESSISGKKGSDNQVPPEFDLEL